MYVYLVIYCPFGAPSHDTTVMGAFKTRKSANAKIEELVEEDYPELELFLTKTKVAA